MEAFEDIEDVREWLEPMDYVTFWRETEPFQITTQPRWHCDDLIARGEVAEELILDCLKMMARIELTEMLGLPPRIYTPAAADSLKEVH